eukprot:1177268-Prorocentrum_minimum.AAC.3
MVRMVRIVTRVQPLRESALKLTSRGSSVARHLSVMRVQYAIRSFCNLCASAIHPLECFDTYNPFIRTLAPRSSQHADEPQQYGSTQEFREPQGLHTRGQRRTVCGSKHILTHLDTFAAQNMQERTVCGSKHIWTHLDTFAAQKTCRRGLFAAQNTFGHICGSKHAGEDEGVCAHKTTTAQQPLTQLGVRRDYFVHKAHTEGEGTASQGKNIPCTSAVKQPLGLKWFDCE